LSRLFKKKETAPSSFKGAATAGKETYSGTTTNEKLQSAAQKSIESQNTLGYFYTVNGMIMEAIQKDARGNFIE
jgi:hypothetical protein